MKNFLKTTEQIALLSGLMLSVSCTGLNSSGPKDVVTETDPVDTSTSFKMHVAFAGGGWRAHTGHTAWLSSTIRPGQTTLGDFFKNVGTISSNSGGSWFSTMTMYDPIFNANMDAGHSNYWLQSQISAFVNQQPDVCPLSSITECIISEEYSLNWRNFVEGVVYDGSKIDMSMTLSSSPMTWAKDKPLLLAGAMLTHDVVFDGTHLGDKSYNWACPSVSIPLLEANPLFGSNDGDKGGKCAPTKVTPDVIPVTFSNAQAQLTAGKIPTFLKGTSPFYNFGYSKNSDKNSPLSTAVIANPLVSERTKIIDAASASSAAAGYAASSDVAGSWIEAFEFENMAVDFQLQGGVVHQVDPPSNFSDFSTKKMVKIADGGAIDNTGVAQLMSFLQESNQDQDFTIASFDSYLVAFKEDFFGNWTTTKYGKDGLSDGMRYLIGDLPTPDPYSFEGYSVRLPELQIFDVTNRLMNPGTSFSNPSCPQNGSGDGASGKIFIQILSVTTRKNEAFGIKANSKGTLIVYASENSALTAPEKLSSFACYNEMLSNMKSAISGNTAFAAQLETLGQSTLSE